MSKKLISFDNEFYTVMANDITKGKQQLTLREAKILRCAISQVTKEQKDFQTYTCNVAEMAKFLNLSEAAMYNDIKSICKSLMTRYIEIKENEEKGKKQKWKLFHWINNASYDGNGVLTIKLSDEIKPFVLELNKYYTQYQLKNINNIESIYGLRLYEILKCDDNKAKETKNIFKYSMQELREMLNCEKTFKQFGQFKEKVIEKGINEINKHTDFEVEVKYIKTGRKITHIEFEIHINRASATK